jgi:hypothetical protein
MFLEPTVISEICQKVIKMFIFLRPMIFSLRVYFQARQLGINPFKTGPSGEPIKNGLLGCFPTFRKDDSDVEYCRQPPSPPLPGPAGFEIVGDLFSANLPLR